jgi:hypothetical protein
MSYFFNQNNLTFSRGNCLAVFLWVIYYKCPQTKSRVWWMVEGWYRSVSFHTPIMSKHGTFSTTNPLPPPTQPPHTPAAIAAQFRPQCTKITSCVTRNVICLQAANSGRYYTNISSCLISIIEFYVHKRNFLVPSSRTLQCMPMTIAETYSLQVVIKK